jgi:light-regulated signal transduction histidine kinase (bacteriophytochrome)
LAGDIESVQEMHSDFAVMPRAETDVRIQSGGYLLELSLDWIVLRASENVHHLLGESHVTLIDEPFGRFVQAQALHDLRNLFSRLSGTIGVGRAYCVRLTDEREFFDIAFQLSDGRVLLEAVPSSSNFGEAFGSVGGLIGGLSNTSGKSLRDGGARRMRALTGCDRVTLVYEDKRAESCRGSFAGSPEITDELPTIIADTEAEPVHIFPRTTEDTSVGAALMRSPELETLEQLRGAGVRACLRVPFNAEGRSGEFRCDSRKAQAPNFEVAAAAELFAQMFAMRLEIDRLRSR